MGLILFDSFLEPAQNQQLVNLQQQCFSPPWSDNQILHQLASDRSLNFAWQKGDQLVGFVFYQLMFEQAEILQIAIDPRYQKSGYAAKLISQSSAELMQNNIEKVLLEVRESNTAAIALYTKLGFKVDGIRKNYYPSLDQSKTREHAKLYSLELTEIAVNND